MNLLLNLLRYLSYVVVDGDWLNDWLTHMPAGMEPYAIEMGKAVQAIFGS
jgi:hypothetical protein